jgi:hypothetical protein
MSSDDNKKKINGEMIMDAIGDIDEDLLRQADEFRNGNVVPFKKKKNVGKIIGLPIAAAAVLALGVIVMGPLGGLRMKGAMESTAPEAAGTDSATYEEAAESSAWLEESEAYEVMPDVKADGESAVGTTNSSDAELTTGTADASATGAEEEKSIWALGEYTGYLDEAENWIRYEDFIDADYDGDSKTDRVYREYYIVEKEYANGGTADYTIEFGNHKTITISEVAYNGLPTIYGDDLDGDGVNEIIFKVTFENGEEPRAWVFALDKDGKYVITDISL